MKTFFIKFNAPHKRGKPAVVLVRAERFEHLEDYIVFRSKSESTSCVVPTFLVNTITDDKSEQKFPAIG